jgi:hypothetical protein
VICSAYRGNNKKWIVAFSFGVDQDVKIEIELNEYKGTIRNNKNSEVRKSTFGKYFNSFDKLQTGFFETLNHCKMKVICIDHKDRAVDYAASKIVEKGCVSIATCTC